MDNKNLKHILVSNQKGQALFEMIIFIPFLIFLYTIYSTTGNSISSSINQQKAVRGYFYSLIKGNSYLNTFDDLERFRDKSIKMVGFSAIGWREKSKNNGDLSFAPCFKFSTMLKNGSEEDCDDKTREADSDGSPSTRIIRIFTYYGVCGPVYSETSDPNAPAFYMIHPANQSDIAKCSLSNSPGI